MLNHQVEAEQACRPEEDQASQVPIGKKMHLIKADMHFFGLKLAFIFTGILIINTVF